jgi:hypothetical protein
MIAVINGPRPKLQYWKSHNDMGHLYPSHFSVDGTTWGWMSVEDYMEKKEFQEFKVEPDESFNAEELKEIKSIVNDNLPIDIYSALGKRHLMYVHRMQQQLKKSGGNLLWQYNQINSDLTGWNRQVVALGHANNGTDWIFRQVSLYDRRIKLPVLNFVCKLLNKLLIPKQKLELRAWNRKKAKMLKELKREDTTL